MITIEVKNSNPVDTKVYEDGKCLGYIRRVNIDVNNTQPEADVLILPTRSGSNGRNTVESLIRHGFIVNEVVIMPNGEEEVFRVENSKA